MAIPIDMTTSDELRLYKEMIDAKASSSSGEIIANAGEFHAAIAMSKLLDKTDQTVRMVVGSFDGAVSDQLNYTASLESAIERGVNFQILFLEKRNLASKAYNILLNAQKSGKQIQFKEASKDFITQLSKNGDIKHFSTFDDNKFRFEKDTEKYLALLSFNDFDRTSKLINIFDTAFNA